MADSTLEMVRRLWRHSFWADRALLAGLQSIGTIPVDAGREFAHVIAAQEVWLARLNGRASALPVWPAMSLNDLFAAEGVIAAYERYLGRLDAAGLLATVHYTNSQGKTFDTPVADILLHVPMHSQYHRGKVNLILRQAGLEPVPTDFISFARGVPAATTPK